MPTTDADASGAARRAARAHWPGRIRRDGVHEPVDVSSLTPAERIAAVWRVTRTAWALAGRELPSVPRCELPGRVIRRP